MDRQELSEVNMKITRPMLAGTIKKIEDIKFPVLVSPKLDGFRCLKIDGKAVSRSFKPIANTYVREYIEQHFPDGIDGELMLRDKNATFNEISSAFRKVEGEPDFLFYVFDFITNLSFQSRQDIVENITREHLKLVMVPHELVATYTYLLEKETDYLNCGYEGLMVRSVDGPYKQGRSTLKEGYLLKLKRFIDSEAEVIGFEEQMHNDNPKEQNELGLTSRATKKEYMKPAGILGKFLVRDLKTGVEFKIGTGDGLTQKLRKEIWTDQDKYVGSLVKYKYQDVGVKNKPRFPVWLGFRAGEDL